MTAVLYRDTGIVNASYKVSNPLWCGTPPPSAIPINRNPRGLSRGNVQARELDYPPVRIRVIQMLGYLPGVRDW